MNKELIMQYLDKRMEELTKQEESGTQTSKVVESRKLEIARLVISIAQGMFN